MKQTIILGALLLVAATLTSCSQENNENEPTLNQGREAVLNIGISPQTRTQTNGLSTSFITEDEIGVFGLNRKTSSTVLNSNVQYIYSDSKWNASPAIAFPIDGSEVNFYAYYPYVNMEKGNTTFDFSVALDQSKGYNQSDLMLAKDDKATADKNTITLKFAHQLALVEVKADLAGIALTGGEIRAMRTVEVDLVAQKVALKDEASVAVKLCKVGENTFRVVLPAQTLSAGRLLNFVTEDGSMYAGNITAAAVIKANELNKISVTFK